MLKSLTSKQTFFSPGSATKFGFSAVFTVGLVLLAVVFAFGSYLVGKIRTTQSAWS